MPGAPWIMDQCMTNDHTVITTMLCSCSKVNQAVSWQCTRLKLNSGADVFTFFP